MQSSPRPFLKDGIYRPTSLREDIEDISGLSALDSRILGNICIKYLLAFLLGRDGADRYDEGYLRKVFPETLESIDPPIDGKVISLPAISFPARLVPYQVKMLLDIPATVEVMEDIIASIEKGGGASFSGWDLGSGSGILLLAQYIGARRARYRSIQLSGVEINEEAQKMADRVLAILGIGRVVKGDTAHPSTYSGLETPQFISSENLTTTYAPFRLRYGASQGHEPFLRNIVVLRKVIGDSLFSTLDHFPHGLMWGSYSREEEPVPVKSCSRDFFGIDKMELIARLSGKDRDSIIFPISIPLCGEWKRVDEIGSRVRDILLDDPLKATKLRWLKLTEAKHAGVKRSAILGL